MEGGSNRAERGASSPRKRCPATGCAQPIGAYGDFALSRGVAGGAVSAALSAPLWAPPIVLMGTVLLLRFPSGRLLSRRWRTVEWVAAVAIGLTVVIILFSPGDLG